MSDTCNILEGDLLSQLPNLPDQSFDAVLCDPPYHLTQNSRGGSSRKCSNQPGDGGTTPFGRHRVGTDKTSMEKGFMGQTWDGGDIAFQPDTWKAVMRVMKPGAYLMAFGGTRTFHRMAVAMEDAGFIWVDTLMWFFGSGFPKSHNIAASIDKTLGGSGERTGAPKKNTYDGASRNPSAHGNPADQSHIGDWGLKQSPHGLPTITLEHEIAQQWEGYGTALKPAYEPILLCRKPFEKRHNTYAKNILKWGCGALNIDGCRIPIQPDDDPRLGGNGSWKTDKMEKTVYEGGYAGNVVHSSELGRWPANILFDESAAEILDGQSGIRKSGKMASGMKRFKRKGNVFGELPLTFTRECSSSQGGASRFFYVSKVSTKERNAGMDGLKNEHPTLKPIDLITQVATLLLPPKISEKPRKLFVPFSGSGSEMIGALLAGWDEVTGIEQSSEYIEIAKKRVAWWTRDLT